MGSFYPANSTQAVVSLAIIGSSGYPILCLLPLKKQTCHHNVKYSSASAVDFYMQFSCIFLRSRVHPLNIQTASNRRLLKGKHSH